MTVREIRVGEAVSREHRRSLLGRNTVTNVDTLGILHLSIDSGELAGAGRGYLDRSLGKVTGRCPDGSVWPKSTDASAVPLLSPVPGVTTEATWLSQGMATGRLRRRHTVCGLAAATAEISSFCAGQVQAGPVGAWSRCRRNDDTQWPRLGRSDRLADAGRQVGRGWPSSGWPTVRPAQLQG